MNKSIHIALAVSLMLMGSMLSANTASAQERVVVLTLGSPVADESFATTFSGTLRYAASQVRGWRVSDADVSVDQVVMALGCENPDDACWRAAATELEADVVIHGRVRRAGRVYRVDVGMFRVAAGESVVSLEDEISVRRSDIDDLRPRIEGYMAQLVGERPAVLVVMTDVPGAEVLIDGESVGRTNARGRLRLESISAGERQLTIQADGHPPYEATVRMTAGEIVDHAADLGPGTSSESDDVDALIVEEAEEPSTPRNWRRIAGWSLIGGAVLSGALGMRSHMMTYDLWTQEQDLDSRYNGYRNDIGGEYGQSSHVCSSPFYAENSTGASRGEWQEWCDSLSQEVWQVVFYAAGGAALGAGLYLLLTDDDDASDEPPAVLTLHPNLSPEGGSLTARLRY
jgi:hypothetical protein